MSAGKKVYSKKKLVFLIIKWKSGGNCKWNVSHKKCEQKKCTGNWFDFITKEFPFD